MLSSRALQRLDIKTAVVRRSEDGETVIPYAAVIYAADGATWVYTVLEPAEFLRHLIVIDRIDGDEAVLSDGPSPDTQVVTVGAAELLGTELDVGS